jgi:hypothetical protein
MKDSRRRKISDPVVLLVAPKRGIRPEVGIVAKHVV